MIIDIIILAILVIPIAIGIKRGFVYMSLQALSWVGSVVASLFLTGAVADSLRDGFLGEMIYNNLTERFESSAEAASVAVDGLPKIISGGLSLDVEGTSDLFVQMLTGVLVSMVAFVIIAVAIKVVLKFLVRPAWKRHHGVINGGDKLLGGVAGLLEGIVLVFLVLAALVPIVNMGSTSIGVAITGWLENSVVAGDLYDSNLLLLVTGGFFS